MLVEQRPDRTPPPARLLSRRPLAGYYLVLGSTALLLILGLVMLMSASSVTSYAASGSSYTVVVHQLTWVALGLPLMWLGSRLTPAAMRRLAYPALALSATGLVLVLVPGLGSSAYGASRWIAFTGSLRLQPSEPAKLALVLWAADLFVRKHRLLMEVKHLLVPLLPVGMGLAALVLLEPDMGTAMVIASVVVAALFVVGAPGRVMGLLLGGLIALGGLLAVAAPYRLARLTSFVDPFKDAGGSGYQAVQGLYALGTGGWFGVGLGASRQKWAYLPNANTDYIYAIVGEELGLIGTLTVLALFAALAYGGIVIALRASDLFCRLVAAGVTVWLLVQAILNVGAVTGLLPITGIPLPLISSGGSSIAVTLFSIGLVLSIARRDPVAAAALHVRSQRRRFTVRRLLRR